MNTNTAGSRISPLSLLRILKRRKLWLLIPILLLTPAVSFYARKLPPRFRARTLVGTEPVIPGQSPGNRRPVPETINAQEQMRAVRETVFSPRVLETVIREFALNDPPADQKAAQPLEDVKSRIQIQLEGPEAFYIGFEGPNALQTMQVANRLAGLLVERASDLRGKRLEFEDTFLNAEVERLRAQLSAQEEGLKAYKASVSQELPERLATNLKELEDLQQQIQAQTDHITESEGRRAAIGEEIKALEKQGGLQDEPPAKTPSQVALDELRLKMNQLRTKYTPEHPEIIRTEKEISDLEAVATPARSVPRQPSPAQMRYFALQAELKAIEPRLTSYRQEREALQSKVTEYERRVSASPVYETTLSARSKDVAMLRARYEALFAKQQEAKLNQRVETNDAELAFKILEAAQLPAAPYSPHPDRIMLFGFLASLAIGVMGVIVAERMDTTFETAEELQRFTNIPVVSSVPTISRTPEGKNPKQALKLMPRPGSDGEISAEQRLHFQKSRLAVLSDPQSVASQQFGILALKVQQEMRHGSLERRSEGRILLVTSSTGEEGKSLTALNLGLALSSVLYGRVLLVDGDLRLPQVHERLGLSAQPSFGDLLAGAGGDLHDYVSRIGNLDVIPGCGVKPLNPAGLLASSRTREVLARLRKEYELVVLDSPPVVPLADSHILAGLADAVLFVVRARQTRAELFQRAVESLGGANLIGVVLNDVEYAATPYAYAYRYYQRHYLG
jgi:succinoglycan biosynthesis transport protein ExoP